MTADLISARLSDEEEPLCVPIPSRASVEENRVTK
jgi:hypothetical protein